MDWPVIRDGWRAVLPVFLEEHLDPNGARLDRRRDVFDSHE